MSDTEVQNIIDKPLDEVKDMTVKELSEAGYSEDLSELGFSGVADKINEEIKDTEIIDGKQKRIYKKKTDI